MWRIEFENGESLSTEDAELVEIHRQKGRFIVDLTDSPNAFHAPAAAQAMVIADEGKDVDAPAITDLSA